MSNDAEMNSVDLDKLDLNIAQHEANAIIVQILGNNGHNMQPNIDDYPMHDDLLLQLSPNVSPITHFDDVEMPFDLSLLATDSPGYNFVATNQPHEEKSITEYDPRFKDCHKMHVKVFYQKLLIGKDNRGIDIVDHKDGFAVFHKICFQNPLPDSIAPIMLPGLDRGPRVSEKTSRLTMRVLNDMDKGLHVWYNNNDGKIYARRHCVSRVFVWSPTLGETKSIKLERNKPQVVFDYKIYFKYLEGISENLKLLQEEKRPVIIFTFGQQWTKSYDLNNIYVRAHVTPIMAAERLKCIFPGKWECESIAKSFCEDDFERSDAGSVAGLLNF